MSGTAPAAAKGLLPFLWGTREQRLPIASIPFVAGAKAATVKLPKNGYISKLFFRFVGNANVTAAGTAGTPALYNLISQYVLSFNGGFQYRQLDGESLMIKNQLQVHSNNDPYSGSPSYNNYNPASATNQAINFQLSDEISLNDDINGDIFLLAAQARNADITLDITFDSGTSVKANTETAAFSGTLYVDALYLLDPDYTKFSMPDLSEIQQLVTDTSYTNVTVGDNVVPVVPVNGPQYMQLAFKGVFNGAADAGGINSAVSRVRLRLNNNQDLIDVPGSLLQTMNAEKFGRKLPAGWFLLDFLDDIGLVNAVSSVGRNILSTEKIASLWLIVTVANGTNLTANNMIKVLKRIKGPATAI